MKRILSAIALLSTACHASTAKNVAMDEGAFSERAIASTRLGDDVKAIAYMREGCEKKDARSCSLLAERYVQGRGVQRDLQKGVALYESACTGGHAVACQKLGSIYANGGYTDGTEVGTIAMARDLAKSLHFHEKACTLDLADGCMSVASMYENGESVEKDTAKADAMYQLACAKGSGDACYAIAIKLDSTERKQERRSLLVKGCQLRGAYACGELSNEFVEDDICCGFGALMRSCDCGNQQACIAAGAQIGKPIIPSYLQQCRTATFSACTFLKDDFGTYEKIQHEQQ